MTDSNQSENPSECSTRWNADIDDSKQRFTQNWVLFISFLRRNAQRLNSEFVGKVSKEIPPNVLAVFTTARKNRILLRSNYLLMESIGLRLTLVAGP